MKTFLFDDLNKDQLDGVAELCFSLAKGAFVLIIYPSEKRFEEPVIEIIKIFMLLTTGLAFTSLALILLKAKEKIKK